MSYTGTKAQAGLGTILALNTGTASVPVWATIGEVTDITQSGRQNETDDATNMQSTAREFIGTIQNPGTWDVAINRVSADAGQVAMKTSFTAASTVTYQLTYPKTPTQMTSGDTEVFSAIVEKFATAIKPDKKVTISASLKVSGAITFTAGT